MFLRMGASRRKPFALDALFLFVRKRAFEGVRVESVEIVDVV